MKLYLDIAQLILLNLAMGGSLYFREGASKREIVTLCIVAVASILFTLVIVYLWNLTLNTVELTIESEMQYGYGIMLPALLRFLF